MSYFFMVAHKAACQTLSSWSLWRHGRGLAGAGDISHTGIIGWRSALWCSFLLWSLPVLQRRSSPLVASNCSVWSSAWLCLGVAADCLCLEVWWQRSGSSGFAIFLSPRSCCRLSWEQWLLLLHLLGPVLLECCQVQPTSLSSVIVLQPPRLCEGWGVRALCRPGDSSVVMDLLWPCDCAAQSFRSV